MKLMEKLGEEYVTAYPNIAKIDSVFVFMAGFKMARELAIQAWHESFTEREYRELIRELGEEEV